MPWRRKWQPTPVFLPGKLLDTGSWRATVHEVAEVWPDRGTEYAHGQNDHLVPTGCSVSYTHPPRGKWCDAHISSGKLQGVDIIGPESQNPGGVSTGRESRLAAPHSSSGVVSGLPRLLWARPCPQGLCRPGAESRLLPKGQAGASWWVMGSHAAAQAWKHFKGIWELGSEGTLRCHPEYGALA